MICALGIRLFILKALTWWPFLAPPYRGPPSPWPGLGVLSDGQPQSFLGPAAILKSETFPTNIEFRVQNVGINSKIFGTATIIPLEHLELFDSREDNQTLVENNTRKTKLTLTCTAIRLQSASFCRSCFWRWARVFSNEDWKLAKAMFSS